jgi:hypothetical protein
LSPGQHLLLLSLICDSTAVAAQGANISYPTSARPAPSGQESAQPSLWQHADSTHTPSCMDTWHVLVHC